MDVQRLLDLSPMPLGIAETLVGVVELLDREGDQTEVQPAARHIVGPPALGDRRIGLVSQALGLRPIAHRPRRGRTLELRSRRSQGPSTGFGTGSRPSQPRFGFGQPARLDTEPAVRRGSEHEQVVVELTAATRAVDRVDHFLPEGNRLHVQVVLAQRVGAQDSSEGDEVAVFVGKIRIDGGVVRQHQQRASAAS